MTYTLHGEPIEVGDRVWDIRHGWGEVIDCSNRTGSAIRVDFGRSYIWRYLLNSDEVRKLLFWDEVKITPPPKPKKNFKKWQWLYTWGVNKSWDTTPAVTSQQEAFDWMVRHVQLPCELKWQIEESEVKE